MLRLVRFVELHFSFYLQISFDRIDWILMECVCMFVAFLK